MSPQKVSLTTFMDFLVRSGTPRVTYINNVVARYDDDYDPAFDYWKQFRDAVVEMHRRNRDKSTLDGILDRVADRKESNYAQACKGYQKFLGRKQVEWAEPPRATWSSPGLQVRVNPELGLIIAGRPFAVKLFARSGKSVNHLQVQAMLRLMATTLPTKWAPMVLDVMSGRPYSKGGDDPKLDALLAGEAAAFVEMWRQVAA